MDSKRIPAGVGELAEAKRGFDQWRRNRRRQRRIPDRLWRMAAKAASVHGVHATACRLRLNSARLKKWLPAPVQVPAFQERPGFVELPWLGAAALPECTLEAEDGAGRKLRIQLKGEATAHAIALGKMLWEGTG
jgi:hypothetical protein